MTISTQIQEVNLSVSENNLVERESLDERISLTPEKLAKELSKFAQWEGVHLDQNKNELSLIGSDKINNPQISVGDLVTAYKAIFEYEANGEALFVDMDFDNSDEGYVVTFGGGFEDTRAGRVLLSADLLLKALSSGIDPWTKVNPLMDDWCTNRNANSFQRLFCKYIRDFAFNNTKSTKNAVEKFKNTFVINSEKAARVATLARVGGSQDCVNYIFNLNEFKKESVLENIRRTGKFSVQKNEEDMICSSEDMSNFEFWKWAEGITELTPREKAIVRFSKKFRIDGDREASFKSLQYRTLYAILAFGDEKNQKFLNSQPIHKLEKVFDTLLKMSDQLNFLILQLIILDPLEAEFDMTTIREQLENESEISQILAFIYFLSEKNEFTRHFFSMSEDDQLTLGHITSVALIDLEFAKLIETLQFHNPLCCDSCLIPKSIITFEDAFVKFTCNHLTDVKRTYLADLIRENVGDKFKFLTAAEIRSKGLALPLGKGLHTTRYWFYPGNEVIVTDNNLNTFLFNQPNMKACAERIDTRRGPYESIDYDAEIPGVLENLELVNKNYGTLAEIFPTLKELNNLVRLLSFFRWIRDYHPNEFDLSAFENAINMGTPTQRTYPIYETVIALEGGGLLRAVGGVDLHSKTQVGINPERINSLITAINSKKEDATFPFESNELKVSENFKRNTSFEKGKRTVYTNGLRQLGLAQK